MRISAFVLVLILAGCSTPGREFIIAKSYPDAVARQNKAWSRCQEAPSSVNELAQCKLAADWRLVADIGLPQTTFYTAHQSSVIAMLEEFYNGQIDGPTLAQKWTADDELFRRSIELVYQASVGSEANRAFAEAYVRSQARAAASANGPASPIIDEPPPAQPILTGRYRGSGRITIDGGSRTIECRDRGYGRITCF